MPGALALIHQLVNGGGGIVADQVVAADLAVGEQCQGAFKVGGSVMDDHELHAVIVIHRGVVGVQARAAGAARKQKEHKSKVQGFHGGRHYTEDDNATV